MTSKPVTGEVKAQYDKLESLDAPTRLRKQLLAGTAKFTIQSKRSGQRFTYWLKSATNDRSKNWSTGNMDRTRFFVKVLTGPDNNKDYEYLGILDGHDDKPYYYRHGDKSKISFQSDSVQAFDWFSKRLFIDGEIPESVEVTLADQCMRCGRTLTVPESVKNHFGPECIGGI